MQNHRKDRLDDDLRFAKNRVLVVLAFIGACLASAGIYLLLTSSTASDNTTASQTAPLSEER